VKKDGLVAIAAESVLGLLGTEDLSKAAVSALEEGLDSPALIALACVPPDAYQSEVRALFERALEELELRSPSPHDALMYLARETARDIVAGTVAPYAGAKKIWDLARRAPAEHKHELDPFIYAASEWEDRPADRIRFEQGILEEARSLINH
jgi:hypothetical protein